MGGTPTPGSDETAPRRRRGLPLRIYLAALVLLSIGTAVVGAAFAGAQARGDARRAAADSASFAARLAADNLTEGITAFRDTVATTAAVPGLSQVLAEPVECTLSLAQTEAFSGHLDVVRSDGSIMCSSAPETVSTTERAFEGAAWLAAALEEPVFEAPVVDATTGERAIVHAVPIPDSDGVVAVFADLDTLGTGIATLFGGPDRLEFVVATETTVLTRSIEPGRWIGTELSETPFGESAEGSERSDVEGTTRLYGEEAVEGVAWTVYAGADLDLALAAADRLYRRQLVIILGGFAVILAVALLVYRQIAKPIRRLSQGVREAATHSEKNVVRVDGPTEIANLAGEINGLLEVVDREATERNQAVNRELEAFSYSVSHDLRAPLRAIDGFAQILVDEHRGELDPEAQRYLDRVRHNADRMGHLIDDLLEFSRLGRAALRKVTVQPRRLVDEALRDLAEDREGRDVQVVVQDLPACSADPRLLRLVFVNLISNALKYTRKQAEARVEIGAIERDGIATYYVKDNGAGFDMRYADKLFQVFQRLHTDELYQGTGIGLATVRRILERHGGRIWAEAELERGATFFFTVEGGVRPKSETSDVTDTRVVPLVSSSN